MITLTETKRNTTGESVMPDKFEPNLDEREFMPLWQHKGALYVPAEAAFEAVKRARNKAYERGKQDALSTQGNGQ